MSEHLNLDIIKKSIDEIYKRTLDDFWDNEEKDLNNNSEFLRLLYYNIISNCLGYQYSLLKNDLYTRIIDNQKLKNIEGNELFNHFYKHQFTHCYIAFIDEYFEIQEAKEILNRTHYNKKEFYLKAQSDVIEEAIDLFHFILQFGVIISEILCVKRVLKYNENDIPFNTNNLDNFLKSDLIVKYIQTTLNLLASSISSNYGYINENNNENILYKARNLIRKINWKDWKTYKQDHYNDEILSLIKHDILEIFNIFISNTFIGCVDNIIKSNKIDKDNNNLFWNKFLNSDSKELNKVQILLLIYGIYMAKNYVNIERQKNGY